MEDALVVVRERKMKGLSPIPQSDGGQFSSRLALFRDSTPPQCHTGGGDSKEVQDLRMWHADTINELEKTRKLLQLQHNINKDYQSEVMSYVNVITCLSFKTGTILDNYLTFYELYVHSYVSIGALLCV